MKWIERQTIDKRSVVELWDDALVRCYGHYQVVHPAPLARRCTVPRCKRKFTEPEARLEVLRRALVAVELERMDLLEEEAKCSTENAEQGSAA